MRYTRKKNRSLAGAKREQTKRPPRYSLRIQQSRLHARRMTRLGKVRVDKSPIAIKSCTRSRVSSSSNVLNATLKLCELDIRRLDNAQSGSRSSISSIETDNLSVSSSSVGRAFEDRLDEEYRKSHKNLAKREPNADSKRSPDKNRELRLWVINGTLAVLKSKFPEMLRRVSTRKLKILGLVLYHLASSIGIYKTMFQIVNSFISNNTNDHECFII